MCVSGQTGSGKTRWVYRFLKQLRHMYTEPPVHTLYCYGIYQPLFDEMEREIPNFSTKQGLPTVEELEEYTKDRQHRLIIIDDLMHEVVQNQNMELVFTRGCHHKYISVIFITQNLFPRGKHARAIALNTFYMVLKKNIRDISQAAIFGRQLYPGKVKGFLKAYNDALSSEQGYLVVDMSPHADDRYRLRTRVFPGEDPIIYKLT